MRATHAEKHLELVVLRERERLLRIVRQVVHDELQLVVSAREAVG